MNIANITNQTRFGRAIRLPLKLIPRNLALPILRGALRGKKWVTGSSDHGCWLGSYEYHKQKLFTRTVLPGDVVFDIGAHVGFYTLLASVLVRESGQVVAFEPMPDNLRYLREHLQLNQIANVKVIGAAVSDFIGQAGFRIGATSTQGTLSESGGLEVETVTLDHLIATGKTPIPRVIKMDIEGGETRALLGAINLLKTHHPTIFLATHGRDLHQQCCDFLSAIGYRLQAITGGSVADTDEIIAIF